MASATRSRLAAREALTSTTSPGRSSARRAAIAASTSGTHPASPCHEPSRAAPCWIGRAAAPTAMTRASSSRAASRPIASCSACSAGPSSAIGPSTANDRACRDRATDASAFSAARIDSGLALYASLITSTPSARSVSSIRQRDAGTAALSASATASSGSPAVERDRGGSERVADVVRADEPQLHRRAAVRRACSVNRARPSSSSSTSSARTSARSRLAECDDPCRRARGHRRHERIVGVQHGDAVGGQRLDQFALGLRDRLAAAELAEMRGADVEHHADAAAARSR